MHKFYTSSEKCLSLQSVQEWKLSTNFWWMDTLTLIDALSISCQKIYIKLGLSAKTRAKNYLTRGEICVVNFCNNQLYSYGFWWSWSPTKQHICDVPLHYAIYRQSWVKTLFTDQDVLLSRCFELNPLQKPL